MENSDPKIPLEKPFIDYIQRPWGFFKQFAHNGICTVSLMTVEPGQRLSLQSHTKRSELWIVIDAGALVQVGNEAKVYQPGDEIWIPAQERHRLGCQGDKPVRVLEIAFGDWDQEDITRYDDDYARNA